MKPNPLDQHPVVSPAHWLAARRELLHAEKEFTHARERLAAKRRALPWTKVASSYEFETPRGRVSLAELFGDRSQLIVYHFMLAPGWEEGCRGCSFVSDHFDGALPHVQARDISLVAVSRAPLAEIARFKARMGWTFPWVSSHGTTFNHDFGVTFAPEEYAEGNRNYNYGSTPAMDEEMPGLSVFARDAAGEVFHTYSTYSRGRVPERAPSAGFPRCPSAARSDRRARRRDRRRLSSAGSRRAFPPTAARRDRAEAPRAYPNGE